MVGATFLNGGPGIAAQLYYLAAMKNGDRVGAAVGDGHLAVGERRRFWLELTAGPDDDVYMVWSCRDIDNNVHQWSADWTYKFISKRRFVRRNDKTMRAARCTRTSTSLG